MVSSFSGISIAFSAGWSWSLTVSVGVSAACLGSMTVLVAVAKTGAAIFSEVVEVSTVSFMGVALGATLPSKGFM